MRYNHFGMLPERAFLKVGGRITLEGGGDGGGGNTTQTTYQTNIPDYLRGPTEQMVARATTLSEQPYQPYTGERVAGFTPAQQQAFADIAGLGTPSQYGAAAQSITGAQQAATLGALNALSYTPGSISSQQIAAPAGITSRDVIGTGYTAQGVSAAPDITGTSYQAVRAANAPSVVGTGYQALGAEAAPDIVGTSYQAAPSVQGTSYTAQAAQYAGGWTPEEAQRYMSPYQQAVTDITKREATTEAMRLNQEMASKAAKAGVFGGSRFGVEQALLGKSLATNLADIQAKGQQEAYTQGLAQFNTEQGMRQAINLANQQAYNQALQFGATQEQAAAIANQAAENQARQFGASQAQAAAVSNQQVRQQANLASQAAYNQALQFGASQDQAAQIANQAAAQQVNLANQGAANQALQFGASQAQNAAAANQQIKMQANVASQQAYNQALQFGASQAQAAQIANQAAALQAAQATQQAQLQASIANQQAALQAAQAQEQARQAAAGIQLQGLTLGANTGLQAAATLGTLGTQQQAADLQRLAAQQSAGAQQQALQQQILDTAYQQAIEQRDWEKNQLGFLSGTIRGTPFSTSSTTTAPGATTASQLAALGLGAYGLSSLLGRKEGGAIKGYAKGGKIEGYAPGGNIAVADMYPDQVLQAVVMGKSDAVPVADAQRELHRRRLLRTAAAGEDATKTLANSRSLADQAEEAGVAALPADNMAEIAAANGGIVGYADGGSIPRYNGNKEYGSVVYGGIEYPIDPTTGKVLYKGVWTSPSLLSGSAASPWNTVGVKPEQTVQQKADAIAANEQMIADVQAGKGVMKNGSYYPIITEGKNAGKVDYKGIPTILDKRMFDSTPPERLVKPSADNTLQAEHLDAAVPPTAPAASAAPAAAPASTGAGRRGVAPGTPAAGGITAGLAAQDEDPYTRILAGAKRAREEMAAGESDPFKDLRASMDEQKAAYADMRTEGRGLAALQAAAAISQGGPGGTWAQLGRGMGALGEAGFKLQNQLQAARQAEMNSRIMMAQAEEARNRGLRGEAIQLATGAEQAGLQAAKLKQDYNLGMAQISASRANAGRNTQLELIRELQKNPELLKTYQGMHAAQEKPLSDADILKSWDPLKYPGMTYAQYYAAMRNAGSMAPTSSLSASDQALVNKYTK